MVGALVSVPGLLLVIFTSSWAVVLGIVLLVFGGIPVVVGIGLLLSSLVARWSARHRSFA